MFQVPGMRLTVRRCWCPNPTLQPVRQDLLPKQDPLGAATGKFQGNKFPWTGAANPHGTLRLRPSRPL